MADAGAQTVRRTRHVRIAEDLADMLGEITAVDQSASASEIIDPLIRREVETLHRTLLPSIRAMRKARERTARLKDADLGGEGG